MISAIFLILCIIYILFFCSKNIFILSILLVYSISIWEWCNIIELKNNFYRIIYFICSFLFLFFLKKHIFLIPEINILKQKYFIHCILTISSIWWIIALFIFACYPKSNFLWKNKTVIHLIIGWNIILPLFASLIMLYQLNVFSERLTGSWIIIYVLMLTFCLDSGGYIFGKLFGKNMFSKIISPNKTWEGVLGGVLLSYFNAYLFYKNKFMEIDATIFFISSSIAMMFGIMGDLIMSMFKRYANIKDSGCLIPGHGGILDRIDSLSASIPIFTYLILLVFRIF